MAPLNILNLIALTSLAILSNSAFGPTGVVAVSSGHQNSHVARGHDAFAKRKRTNLQKRCKVRPPPVGEQPPKGNPSGGDKPPADDKPPAPPAENKPPSDDKPPAPPADDKPPADTKPPVDNNPPPSGGANPGAAKMGIAWPNGPEDNNALKYYKTDSTKIIYTWSPWCPQGAKGLGFECAPMLWGDKHIDPWVKNVINGPDSYAKYALGMNEPNEPSQANIDPWHAAGLWQQYIQPLKARGYTLISPACTNGPDGKEWMKNFIDACKGCTIDAIAVHYYGTSAQGMIDHSEDYFKTFGKPIWITEAACQDFSGRNQQCNKGQIFDFMNKVKGYVNSSPHVQTFFPFGVMHDMYNVNPLNQLMSGNGQPTDLGWSFLG